MPTDLPAKTQLNTEAIEAWKTLVADDGLAFYPDWSTNTMYDTMSQGMQGIIAGDVSRAGVHRPARAGLLGVPVLARRLSRRGT